MREPRLSAPTSDDIRTIFDDWRRELVAKETADAQESMKYVMEFNPRFPVGGGSMMLDLLENGFLSPEDEVTVCTWLMGWFESPQPALTRDTLWAKLVRLSVLHPEKFTDEALSYIASEVVVSAAIR